MFQTQHLQEKWQPVLEHPELPKIGDAYRRAVTTLILENQEKSMKEDRAFLGEAAPTNATGSAVDNWDPILISLVRRSMPNLIAYDICGVQPMSGPTGLIFAMRARATSQTGKEALADPLIPDLSNQDAAGNTGGGDQSGTNPAVLNDSPSAGTYSFVTGQTTAQGETLGDGTDEFAEMAFSIEKHTVTAVTRALKAEYTMELAQDLKAIHGLDAETELANILSSEILMEINREVVRTIYNTAVKGAQVNTTTAGIFDLDTDSNGRWSVEKFKGLLFAIERDANAIGQETRRGKGNIIITSADVASALQMAGVLDYTPALSTNLNVDDTTTTFAGVLNGRYRVYIDPFAANIAAKQYYVVGYKGTSPYDAGVFYCPYVPLQMVRAVGENSFQPKIGFKTRYGMAANPFHTGTVAASAEGAITLSANTNKYYRRVQVTNLM
ncbi:MAG: ATP-binding protein [Alphaproteobacteria bacterium TMED194]|nr:MAG: ATP-binding protein [Alphaproteobacteria bacterium TMED194]|tara:strand:+ start:6270 stop:7589 length:1320 start_codon:yes stop_codon:yes gene_type:complete